MIFGSGGHQRFRHEDTSHQNPIAFSGNTRFALNKQITRFSAMDAENERLTGVAISKVEHVSLHRAEIALRSEPLLADIGNDRIGREVKKSDAVVLKCRHRLAATSDVLRRSECSRPVRQKSVVALGR
jgi:hypothetical protein